jgi:hypothetical protein
MYWHACLGPALSETRLFPCAVAMVRQVGPVAPSPSKVPQCHVVRQMCAYIYFDTIISYELNL